MENEFRPVIPVRDTERIISHGVTIPEKRNIFTKPEDKREKLKVDKLMTRVTDAKTFLGLLRAEVSVARNDKNEELAVYVEHLITKYKEFEEIGIAKLRSWRGKSGIIECLKSPDKVIVVRMRKDLPGQKPHRVETEITKQQINAVISSLNYLRNHQPIDTSEIAMSYSRILGLGHSAWDYGDKPFETDRSCHNLLTNILGFLEQEGVINYRKDGKTTILKEKMDVQEILKS